MFGHGSSFHECLGWLGELLLVQTYQDFLQAPVSGIPGSSAALLNFRSLIFLLIACDMFKSVWYLISAAVNTDLGQLDSGSPFCQGGGTLVALGVESSGMIIQSFLKSYPLISTRFCYPRNRRPCSAVHF